MTYKELTKIIENVWNKVPNAGDFVLGDVYELNHKENITYPAFALTNNQHTHNHIEETTTYNFYLFYVDRLTVSKNNRADIHSTGEQVLHSVLENLEEHYDITINNYTLNFVNERFNDECAVVYLNVLLTTDNCYSDLFIDKSDCEELEEDNRQLRIKNNTLREENFQLNTDVSRLNGLLSDERTKNRTLTTENKILKTENTELTAENTVLESKLAKITDLTATTNTTYIAEVGYKTVFVDVPTPTPTGGTVTINGDETFTFSNGVIPTWKFANDNNINSATLNDGITTICDSAFYHCDNLQSVTIPNTVTSIDYEAFYSTALQSVEIPNSVTNIGSSAFASCKSLQSVELPNEIEMLAYYLFSGCTALQSVEIPSSVTRIGTASFANCSGLTSVAIPNTVTSIDNRAFSDCPSLQSVVIPSSVTSIGVRAFYKCSGLTSITVEATTPPTLTTDSIHKEWFGNTDCPIYVPSASLEAYKTAPNWQAYASRIQAITD